MLGWNRPLAGALSADGRLTLDPDWGPVVYRTGAQQPGTGAGILGDFVVVQTNFLPSSEAMTVTAVSTLDSDRGLGSLCVRVVGLSVPFENAQLQCAYEPRRDDRGGARTDLCLGSSPSGKGECRSDNQLRGESNREDVSPVHDPDIRIAGGVPVKGPCPGSNGGRAPSCATLLSGPGRTWHASVNARN